MTDEIFKLYRNHFLPAYSDFVVLSQSKPQQILIEESNTLSHLAQAFNEKLEPEKRTENLNKAHNHIIRATLDLHKLIFALLKENLDKFVHDDRLRLGFNKPDSDVLKDFSAFIQKGRDARKTEVNSIGNNPLRAIVEYEEANHIGFNLYLTLDIFKSTKVTYFLKKHALKEIAIAFIIGCVSSYVAGNLPDVIGKISYVAGKISEEISTINHKPAPPKRNSSPPIRNH